MTPEYIGSKRCLLDLKMRIGDDVCSLEVQVADKTNYRDRCMFYLSRLCSGAIEQGDDYQTMPHVILISILDFVLFDCEGYYSEFVFLERFRHELLSDKLRMVFLEAMKAPKIPDGTDMLSLWLCLIRAETTEELDAIRRLGVDIMSEAAQCVRELQADEQMRALALSREMAEHDWAQELSDARREGEQHGIAMGEQRGIERERRSIIRQMYANGFDASLIARATSCTEQQVAAFLQDR
jgi:predicted transposase/invertase (TIGR01784 family)